MSKIRILPEHLANQIAAGEVVERPASVVKELIENSIDAGSQRIEIEIEGSGTQLIRVIDDGEGMSEDDILMSLERHGTSKIHTQEDLEAINSLGFRGEAIPSIGSVSRMSITSRTVEHDLGTHVEIHYGTLKKVHETGCRVGTTVEVRSLFGNTPARRKFLRTARTEVGHIEEVVKNLGLGSPEITFILRIGNKETLHLDNKLSLAQRLGLIQRYSGPYIEIGSPERKTNQRQSVFGLLIPPETVTTGSARIRLFVNGRAIRDRVMMHAVGDGLRNFLMKGKSPSGFLHLTLLADEIDVNVHPAKHEVRFKNSRDIHTLISSTIKEALISYQGKIQASVFGKNLIETRTRIPIEPHQVSDSTGTQSTEEVTTNPPATPSNSHIADHERVNRNSPELEKRGPIKNFLQGEEASQPLLSTSEPIVKNSFATQEEAETETIPNDKQSSSGHQPYNIKHNQRIIGQFENLYILCQNSDGLLVVDQHAAHERLLFEKLKRHYRDKTIARQTLLFPETFELTPTQIQVIDKYNDEIQRMGFSVQDFGGNTYVVSAVPVIAKHSSSRELFLNILDSFTGEQPNTSHEDKSLDNILATMACKAAVKGGTELSHQEIDKLLSDMAEADLFSHCPHGRPVIKQFSHDEIKKWFHRT